MNECDDDVCLFVKHGNGFAVEFKYNPDLIDLVKRLPPRTRKWDNISKKWLIDSCVVDKFIEYAEDCDFEVEFHPLSSDPRKAVVATKPPAPPSALFKYATDAELTAMYRAIVFRNHPDRGGTNEAMWEINSAWESLRKSRNMK